MSRIFQAFIELYLIESPSISPYSSSITETGYPIALNISQLDNSIYIYFLLNLAFWFFVIWGIWKLLRKSRKKKNAYLSVKHVKEAVQERRDSAHKG